MRKRSNTILPPVIDDIEDWPIYRLSEDRRAFVQEIEKYTLERLMGQSPSKTRDLISKTIYTERIRIKEEPWKVDPPKEKQFWRRLSHRHVRLAMDHKPEEVDQINREHLHQIILRYAEEIVGTFRIKTFLFARRFLTFFFTRLLNTAALRSVRGLWGRKHRLTEKLAVEGEVEKVRKLFKQGTVVVVPTHFSNLDSILIGYAMDTYMGLPSFSYGAGLNLYNTGYTAYFMNRLGAYRVDRRKKNGIYLETLKAMSMLSIKRGINSLFFPGGTRSRSGKLEDKLKLGLLGTTVEAQRAIFQEGRDEKVFIVPLVLGYHFVLEAEFLIEQHLRQIGKEQYLKTKDNSYSPFRVLQFAWKVFSKGNNITLSFGQPMDVLGNPVDEQGNSYDQHGRKVDVSEYFLNAKGEVNEDLQREAEYTSLLGDRIVDRYHKDNIVLTSHLVAFAAFRLLEHQNPQLDLYGILRLPAEEFVFPKAALGDVINQLRNRLLVMERLEEVKLSPDIHEAVDFILQDGIKHLGNFHVSNPLYYDKKERIVSASFKVLYFYHNRLDNYELERYIDWKNIGEEALLLEEELYNQEGRF
ncbi:MAG: 1-acyl-sn-glycerol-3-phosphate acyltransferase [Lewinella sp.]|jgi:glycerol-3-phosphate O-acyltransferase|uniref:1-acyl-sn-glycerol-3-phosphate acyltransferase n=1 Tax=Lewinella sp. TaxID=2004506 RepID=UPI003D6BA069